MNNNYFRITAYYPAEDISCIMDTYGKYDEIWQFSAYLVKLKFKIIDVAETGQFDYGNILPIKEKSEQVYLNADSSYDVYDTRGADTGLEFTAEQVNAWLDQGYGSISFHLAFTTVDGVIDEVVVYGQSSTMTSIAYIEDYSGSIDLTLILNRDNSILIWTQVDHSPQPHSTFTLSNFKLNHYSYNSGYGTVIDETIDESSRLTSLTISIPDGINWWENPPTISGEYRNNLYAAGVRTIVISEYTATPSTPNINLPVVHYQSAESGTDLINYSDSGNNFTREIALAENSQYISFAFARVSGGGVTIGTQLTLTFSYSS